MVKNRTINCGQFKKKMKYTIIFFVAILISCNRIENGNKLSKSDIKRIESLYKLDKSETIINFYTEFKNSVAGNFYTEQRIASYWIDEKDETKNKINSSYFTEIKQIDTVIYAGAIYSPYLKITKVNNSSFNVCFDGEKKELRKIFNDVLNHWNIAKKKSNGNNSSSNTKLNCEIDNFLNDNNVPKLAKDIYFDNDWDLSNDNETLALLDSLSAKNKTSRPFYFKVITKTYKKSDGYFSEGLGFAGKEYVENNTREFASYFDNRQCFTDKDLETWCDIVLLEIELEQDNIETTKEEHYIYGYCRKLRKQSEKFPKTQKETISKFIKILEKKWSEFLKHI